MYLTMAKQQSVAVIGTGMAGLVTAYILRSDPGRFDVEVFEKQASLSLDSASITPITNLSQKSAWDRIDLPMRIFASGFYENLKRMYEHFGVQFSSPRFIYTLSTVPEIKSNTSIRPKFIHSSNNHQIPPLRPEGLSWGNWLLEVIYLAFCYYWFTACCFFIPPRSIDDKNGGESFRSYLERIYLPDYYIQQYLLPLMSCVTTCTHKALLDFPAIDIIGYETKTFRKPHYTVLGGVNKVQDKLAEGLKVKYCSTVTRVQNIDNKVKVTWKDEGGSVTSSMFDHVIMAVTPDVVGAIFSPLESAMAKIPISFVYSVVHRDFDRLSKCRDTVKERISTDQGPFCSQAIHICSNAAETESTHEHPSSLLISTSPIVPIDPKKILHTVTFTRVLRTPTSRQITREIFDVKFPKRLDEKLKPQWRNGDGNVWLVGGWCWDGMVMLEGCIASALRIADRLDIEVPWTLNN